MEGMRVEEAEEEGELKQCWQSGEWDKGAPTGDELMGTDSADIIAVGADHR